MEISRVFYVRRSTDPVLVGPHFRNLAFLRRTVALGSISLFTGWPREVGSEATSSADTALATRRTFMRSFASHRVSCRAAITVAERSIATTVPHAGSVTRIGVSSTIVE